MRAVRISAAALAEPRATYASVVPAHWPVVTESVRRPTGHRRPGFLHHLTAQTVFAKTCQNFSHTFPKTIPQTSAGCSVLGIIRGYILRTCPSDRAIGAQPDRCDQAAFFFSACFFEVFFLPTAARPCGAGYKHTVYSTSVAPTWRTAPGPWGPYGRRPHMQAAPGRAESPETASERPVTGLSAPIETMSNRLNVRTAQCQKSPNMSETAHIFIQLSLS